MLREDIVYIVDDDAAVRRSVSLVIEAAGYRIVPFAAAREFLDRAPALIPSCLILDVRMPGMDGLELLERLAERKLRFPTIVMTGHGDIAVAVRAMKAGAVDFLEKPFSEEELIERIRGVFARLGRASEEAATASEAATRLARLSTRERQVLERLMSGLRNKTIASDLSLSPRTVEVYRARVMDKMMATNFADLMRLALAAGVTPKSP
jgi:two-component system response regulator FixJ